MSDPTVADPIGPASPGTTLAGEHISSAIVSARPLDAEAVAVRLGMLPGTEVHAIAGPRIVVVMEAANAGALADLLTEMATLPGVLAVGMVFEQALDPEPVNAA